MFCRNEEKLRRLYPRTFQPDDLEPATFSARHSTKNPHCEIVRCLNCGLVFSQETLNDSELFDLYSKSEVNFDNLTQALRRDYWRPVARHVQGNRRASALEIGCSSGFFLEELLAQGFKKVEGVEPSLAAKRQASSGIRESIVSGFFEAESIPANEFDLVCSFHTLDHVNDPVAFVNACHRALKPGGICYFVVHDVEALQAKIFRERSPIIHVGHIYLFSKRTLRRLLDDCQLSVVAIKPLVNTYPLSYWLSLLPVNAKLKSFLKAAGDFSGLSRWSPPVRAGNLYAISQKSHE